MISCDHSFLVKEYSIVVTDEEGNIISDDPDQWQPRIDIVDYSDRVLHTGIYPAFPNPSDDLFRITYHLEEVTSIKLKIEGISFDYEYYLVNETKEAGQHSIWFYLNYMETRKELPRGKYKIIFNAGNVETLGIIEKI